MTLEAGATLRDRYKILGELGRGGMGAVHRGFDTRLEVDVAIKENFITSPESVRQFTREAKLLARLQHPNLPRVTDHFVIPDVGQYLVMDFIDGETAEQRLRQHGGPLPQEQVLGWAKEILAALEYLHGLPEPILHRDIKPSNIKITPQGHAVLVDFGLAKVSDPTRPTTLGAKAHTPGFAPPEQYGQGRTTIRTDIYALGATLYMLLTNKIPADSLDRTLGNAELIPLRKLNPAISDQVVNAIERAMALHSASRFASAKEFESALFSIGAGGFGQPGSTVVGSGGRTVVAGAERRKADRRFPLALLLIPGMLAALIVVAAGGFLLWRSSGTSPAATATATEPVPSNTIVASATEQPVVAPAATQSPRPVATSPIPQPSPTVAGTPLGGGQGQIAFVSERNGLPQIFLIGVDGSDVTQLTDQEQGACQPAWSPDGEMFLFVTPCNGKSDSYPEGKIWVANADGSQARQLISRVGGAFDPDWSAAGIAFTNLEGSEPRIWRARSDGANLTKVSIGRSADFQPSWSPDGARLAFMNTSRAGSRTIFWMFSDGTFPGSNPDQVTRDVLVDDPAWSPRGDLVAFVTGSYIWVVPWEGRGFGAERITSDVGNDGPSWSPDANWMAIEAWVSADTHDIYIVAATGGGRIRVSSDPALNYQPAWRP